MNILNEIKFLRNEYVLNIILQNSNSYRVIVKESDGISAYYFSCPIYDKQKKLIKLDWVEHNGAYYFNGSNANLEASKNFVSMTNDFGFAYLSFDSDVILEPTFNGVAITVERTEFSFVIKTDRKRRERENGNYFALMQDEFVPFITVSCICGKLKKICFPLEVSQKKQSENKYLVTVKCLSQVDNMLFEVNLHAQKLIFDTTVESNNPYKNNAFGGTAFLGNSEYYGEQWLYTRFDSMQLSDINFYTLKEASLYLPKFSQDNNFLETYKITAPWCSFGSTWNSKINYSELLHTARQNKKYEIVEVSDVIKDIFRLKEPRNQGVVIKGKERGGYSVISTGDNYLLPQILEIKLKNN